MIRLVILTIKISSICFSLEVKTAIGEKDDVVVINDELTIIKASEASGMKWVSDGKNLFIVRYSITSVRL